MLISVPISQIDCYFFTIFLFVKLVNLFAITKLIFPPTGTLIIVINNNKSFQLFLLYDTYPSEAIFSF